MSMYDNIYCKHSDTFLYEYVNGNVSEICRDCGVELQ